MGRNGSYAYTSPVHQCPDILTCMTALQKAEILRPLVLFRPCETLARHFSMGVTHNLSRIHHSVFKRPASFPRNSFHGGKPMEIAVLRQEMSTLLSKGAIEDVHPSQMEAGFYSHYFVIQKRRRIVTPYFSKCMDAALAPLRLQGVRV